jgi:Sodium Bile acid symporter family
VLLGASRGGTTANLLTHLARGDTALSIAMTAISSIAAAFTVRASRPAPIQDRPRRADRRGCRGHFVARIVRPYWGGDHSLFLGRVEFACFSEDARPLLFHGGQHGSLSSAG